MKKHFILIGLISCIFPLSNHLYAASCDSGCNLNYATPFRGLYVGGNVGFASFSSYRNIADIIFFSPQSVAVKGTSWTAGVQAGYDWMCRCNSLVLGLVADWNWSNARNYTHPFTPVLIRPPYTEVHLHWLSTIRGRAGFPIQPDFLVYLTGGVSIAEIKTRMQFNAGQISTEDVRWGWVGGFGGEWALWCRWSLNAEMLYTRFRRETVHFNPPPNLALPSRVDYYDDTWVGRIGLNYRFCL